MIKFRLSFPEGFTEHATALLNHIHRQPPKTEARSLQTRLRRMQQNMTIVRAMEDSHFRRIPKESLR